LTDADQSREKFILAKKLQIHTDRGVLDLLFILILLFIFAVSSLVIVMIGANAYKSVVNDMQANFDLRIPLSYISTKVQQHDETNAIHLLEKEGTDVLVLESTADSTSYETWIYVYDHQLYEVLLEKGQTMDLSSGMAILAVSGLDLKMTDSSLLEITSYDNTGKTLSLSLNLRSSPQIEGDRP